ncbi:hypothetical protein HQ865_07690 [Mucilaginibacter mali]|uniref:Uncharacterized protein n=1 Tax=Mucilaginibacter mali TaxID=2740462 RepID=A0A7D4UCR3_9SPHI|nr:hypothetical protein [Mucilaginibacter mali]QKJ29639.1 hypothetical protein HQ865_07690 [Mucilaginibacter mali]
MKSLLIVLLAILFMGCKHHPVNNAAVKMIQVVVYRNEVDSVTFNYTDSKKIKRIVNAINHSKRQKLHFDMDCSLHLVYPDSTVTVLANGTSISCNGVTYQMTDSMNELIN